MAPFLKIFWNVGLVYFLDTLGVENFDEIAPPLADMRNFVFLPKIQKFKMVAIFLKPNIFF